MEAKIVNKKKIVNNFQFIKLQNYRNIIKQTKGLSKILDTSAVYWKEAADDLGKTFCQCGNRENTEIVEIEYKLNKDKPDDEEPNLKKNKKPKIIHNLVNGKIFFFKIF